MNALLTVFLKLFSTVLNENKTDLTLLCCLKRLDFKSYKYSLLSNVLYTSLTPVLWNQERVLRFAFERSFSKFSKIAIKALLWCKN